MSTPSLSTSVTDDLFYLKTSHGFVFKMVAELLSHTIKNACFLLTPQGMYLKGVDFEQSLMLKLDLQRENFNSFQCQAPLTIGLNTTHLYKLLKSIKKKDTVVFRITTDQPMILRIVLEQAEEHNQVATTIKFLKIQPIDVTEPTEYDDCLLIGGKEFQKLVKSMATVGKSLMLFAQPKGVRLFCDGGELYSREVVFGQYVPDKDLIFQGTFPTQSITQLMKLSNLSTNIQLFTKPNLPLKIKIHLSILGTLEVFLKSMEQLAIEKPE